MEHLYSTVAKNAPVSDLARLFELSERPDVISFAGGLPDPNWFLSDVEEIGRRILRDRRSVALQYGPVPGLTDVREYIAQRMTQQDMPAKTENILITSGALQGLDLLCRVFIDPGDSVVIEAPTYLGAISTIRAYQADFIPVICDENGLKVDELEEYLENAARKPKFIYTVPTFQNPSGYVLSLERRKKLINLASMYQIPIIEDSAYGELRFSGNEIPTLKALDTQGWVIFLGSFSKIFSPGVRVGWVAAPENIINKLILFKQGADQMSSSLSQLLVYEVGKEGLLDKQIELIKRSLKQKRDITITALRNYFGDEAKWTVSEGGFYTWVQINKAINTFDILEKAITKHKVAYVAGSSFYVDRSGENCLRICYSMPDKDEISEGIKRLRDAFNQ